jgi:hypothetical protein
VHSTAGTQVPRITQNYLNPLPALALLLTACQPPDETPSAATTRQVDSQPTLVLTSDRLPEGHELNGGIRSEGWGARSEE